MHVDDERRVTRKEYVQYRLAIKHDFNAFITGRRLMQQWVVDSYVKFEKDRLQYLKSNQKQLRTHTYKSL